MGCALAVGLFAIAHPLAAQIPSGQQLPSPDQAEELLRTQPALVDQLRQRLTQSGMTPDQVRARLRAAGYPDSLLDQFLQGADTTQAATVGPRTLDAVKALGVLSARETDSLQQADSLRQTSDSLQNLIDSLRLVRADSLRADSLADSARVLRQGGLKRFGLETFRRTTTRFLPNQSGPVDENYQLGPGDVVVLILTGDVERAYTLDVTREGFVVIPQVGQVYAANLTLGQLQDQLYDRLGRVYSGVRRGPDARTRFQLSLAKLRNIQIYVTGDVVRPGAYQLSSAGTVLSALYAAGGPTESGSLRRVDIRRGGTLVDSLDLYDYLMHGINRTDIHAPDRGRRVRPGARRPLGGRRHGTAAGDLRAAPGRDPPGRHRVRRGVQSHRIRGAGDHPPRASPASRGADGRARVVIAVGADQFATGVAPAVPMAPGDSVTVYSIASRQRGYVTVRGNVWVEGQVGFTPGMKLSDALRLAGGVRPDVFTGRILLTRTREDSSMMQLRSAFADSTGRVADDLVLQDEDEIRVFSRTTFRPAALRRGGRRRPQARPSTVPGGYDHPRPRAPGRRPDRGRRISRPRLRDCPAAAARARWPRPCACRSTRASRWPARARARRPAAGPLTRRFSPTTTC